MTACWGAVKPNLTPLQRVSRLLRVLFSYMGKLRQGGFREAWHLTSRSELAPDSIYLG